jgi:prolycopene isomerase
MGCSNKFEAIVVGAGVGGLTTGTLLAQRGLKVLILEQNDRVGGRALSINGREISDNGLEWYQKLLNTQYSYLAGSHPDMDSIVRNRMLDGYALDIGYHAISVNGAGFMQDFESLIGGIPDIKKHGSQWASYYKGNIYRDLAGNDIDPMLMKIANEGKIPYLDFYTECHGMTDEALDDLEKVSLHNWAEKKGITQNDVIYDHLHSIGTLFSTINNPKEISVGEIFRYFKYALGPKLMTGTVNHNGGFIKGGVMEWSKAVVKKFQRFGGSLKERIRVIEVKVNNGRISGVIAELDDGSKAEFESDIVISNIPIQQTFKVIDRAHFPKKWVDFAENMSGCGSYTPYIGLNKLVVPEEEAMLGLKHTCILPRAEGFDHDIYICWNIQSILDRSSAPEGKYLFSAYLPMTEKEAMDKKLVDRLVMRLPEFMEEIYPGFNKSVDWKLDLVCWKLEGVAKSITQAGTQKVSVKSEHIKGLFFSGDTARGYGVGMDCAIASGMICAGKILGVDFGIR